MYAIVRRRAPTGARTCYMYAPQLWRDRPLRDCVRDRRGVSGMDDLILLTMAVLGFSLFFAALAGAYVARQNVERGQRLQDSADAPLAAVVDHPQWTASHGLLLAGALAI